MSLAPPPEARPYRPYGGAEQALYCREPEVLLAGPSGTGKSRACLEKLHLCAMKYPGMRGLIVRKTRESLSESGLVTFEDKVLPERSRLKEGPQRNLRQAYRYANGSELIVGGLDKASRIMSTEFDLIYVQEATELTEHDWEALTTRLRNGVMPYQQLLADCNPDAPGHWLKRRCDRGATMLLHGRHEDNPTVTPAYLAKLDALTGVRHLRLRRGVWAAAEGMVYDAYDPAVHLVPHFPIPATWPRYRVVDFGYTNPFVCQWWAEDPDGRLYRYRELYGTKRLVEDWAHEIHELSAAETIRATICDHDAEDRATLERHMAHRADDCSPRSYGAGGTSAASKEIAAGVQAVQARLRAAGDDRPRLFYLRDALVRRDGLLEEAKKPTCAEEEIESYVWDRVTGGRLGERTLEVPMDRDNHAMDTTRYLVMHFDDPNADRMRRIGQAFSASATSSTSWEADVTGAGAGARLRREPVRAGKRLRGVRGRLVSRGRSAVRAAGAGSGR